MEKASDHRSLIGFFVVKLNRFFGIGGQYFDASVFKEPDEGRRNSET
jgi:hypothetical protein